MSARLTLILVLLLVFLAIRAIAKNSSDAIRMHCDLPVIVKDDKMILNVFYSSDTLFKGLFQVQIYKYQGNDDSILVLRWQNDKTIFNKDVNKLRLDFSINDSNSSYNEKFYGILKRTGNIPPGSYKVFLTIKNVDKIFRSVYLHDIDSLLSPNSPVRKEINSCLIPKQKSFFGMRLKSVADHQISIIGADQALAQAKGKIDKAARKRGLKTVHNKFNGKSFVDLFYKEWFAGRYELKNNEAIEKQINEQEKSANPSNPNSATSNELGHPSLFSQYKKNNSAKKDDEIKGEIGLTTNVSSGQEQYSGVNNNYYELRARIEMPVANIPVVIEGLYTSQDVGREIKSSYFRVHYNIEKMKEELNRTTGSYNSKISETKSKSAGMTQIYSTSIINLEGQKAKLQSELNAETGVKNVSGDKNLQKGRTGDFQKQAKDTIGLKQGVAKATTDSTRRDSMVIDSAGKAVKTSDTTLQKISEKNAQKLATDTTSSNKIAATGSFDSRSMIGPPTDSSIQKAFNDLQKKAKDSTGIKKVGITAASDTARNDSVGKAGKPTDSTLQKSSDKEAKVKNKSAEEQRRIDEKQKKIEALDKKIEKYKILLAQDQNTNHFDSIVAYNKTKDMSGQSDATYKQMAKRSSALLPDGQAKGFLTGITNMDAGMFPKEESKYTMAGQMMKGVDFGYDLGICQADITLGKTQYVGADGNLDKYTCYSEKTTFKLVKNHKISLIYYGYTPDRTYYSGDAFFKNMNISEPGFYQPVHIVSLNYKTAISKYVTIGGEAAMSLKKSDSTDSPVPSTADKMAYDFSVTGRIPNTSISLEGSYNSTGKDFVNNTLPVSLSGTQQYKLAGKDNFFRSFLSVGIEYNFLIQNNFSTQSSSTKWGFDLKTNSKRYPNLAVSYKPFTTFRSFTDTLTIPQRPLIGSVWTGKATWQIKRREKSLRFLALYNMSMTTMDTAKYGNKLMQLTTIYTDKMLTSSVTVGYSQITGTDITTIQTSPNNMFFLNLSGSYKLSKQFSVSGGQDFGVAGFGFCKYGLNGGFTYRPEKKPYTIRVNLRFTDYELNAAENWQQLYSGNIDLVYKFKMKNDKRTF